jgi:hypothetical protein
LFVPAPLPLPVVEPFVLPEPIDPELLLPELPVFEVLPAAP